MVSAWLTLPKEDATLASLNPYYAGRWFLLIVETDDFGIKSLNPYYAGRWFLLKDGSLRKKFGQCLNPYYAGRWFLLKLEKNEIPTWGLRS